jgi:hypothetical protein
MTIGCRNRAPQLRRVTTRLLAAVSILAAPLLSGLAGCAGSSPPPPAHAELRPVKPHPRAVWVPGRWVWSGRKAGYRWVEGHWKIP